ncbi:hypothetical protein HSBGL_1993 [Halapricum desulfuricans]|uniref:Uncharacterized protein n=1 Tax=Halapricum desulfuricans TaxID=2841257 RepID=A0A897NNB5_9EURY|nr:hypothetical protein [Halapricum desulfuricans]QSG12403.1 hypothetical protein HSBGL_1993 [Halapricum desulfuricans]
MAGNDDLHPILKRIHQTVGDILKSVKEVRQEVKKVHTVAKEGFEEVIDAIYESIQAQAEMKMMERVAEVREIRPQITAEQERIETEHEELERQLDRIAERYERKHEELDEKAAKRIRDLGAHIFEIDEEEFEEGIEQPFVEHVTTTWQTLQSQNQAVEQRRHDRIESTTGEVVSEIHEFVDQQHELVERIQRTRTSFDPPQPEPTTVQVPYYVVTVERDGQTEQHVVAPSQATSRDGPVDVSLDTFPGMERLVGRTSLTPARSDTIEGSEILDGLESHIDDSRPLLSYEAVVADAVDDQVTVATEGGS